MAEIEIGRGKDGRRGISLDEVSIVPTRRTRAVADVELSWKIDAYRFALPFLAAGLERPIEADDAIAIGRLGGLALVDLEALWAADPRAEAVGDHIATIKAAERPR